MGGVDKLDALVAVYRTRIRQRKWYWPLVAYLLDVSVVNGWLLMKKIMPNDNHAKSLPQITHKQIVHLTSNALIVAVQDSCRGSFRLVRANLKCDPIDAEF
jgi:hypothetical protein